MKKGLLLVFCLSVFWSSASIAQISIAPTSVFLDQNGIGSLFITNPSDVPQEVAVGFLFGYPGNDAQGNLLMVYGDSLREGQFGMGDRLRAFPRTFILGPRQQQTVRLQVRPDRSLPAGTYFTRIKVTSNAQTADVENVATEGVSTQVNFKFDQVIAAFHKVGDVQTGLEFGEVTTQIKDNSLRVVTDFTVTGNSPFLGSVTATMKNSQNEVLATQQQTTALYFSGKRALELTLQNPLSAGNYEIELLFETKRSDIPSSDLVQSPPISKKITLTVN
jgi:methionine-rich copper-binding protein CopC